MRKEKSAEHQLLVSILVRHRIAIGVVIYLEIGIGIHLSWLLLLSAGHYCVTGVDSTMIWIYSGLSNVSF